MKQDNPQVIAPVLTPNKPQGPSTRSRLLVGIGIVLILALIIGLVSYNHHHNQQKAAKAAAQPYAFSYQQLSSHSIPGQKSGSGMSYSIPTQLKSYGPTGKGVQQAQYFQTIVKDQHGVRAANANVASVYSAAAPSPTYLKALSKNITTGKGAVYDTAVAPIKGFVTGAFKNVYTSDYNFTFTNAKAFKSTNISGNAWSMDFTASPKPGVSQTTQPALQGIVVLAVGKTTFYYFFEDAINYNWNDKANQSVWQNSINSYKIDQ